MITAFQSTFAIPASGGWGYLEVPYTAVPWDGTLLPGGSPSVTAGVASLTVTPGSAGRFGQAVDLGTTDGEVPTTGSLDSLPLGSGALVQNRVFFRIQDANNGYSAGWYVNAAGAVKARIQKIVAGTSSTISNAGVDVVVAASGYTPGDQYLADLVYTGTNFQLYVWKAGTSKPGSPTTTATDSTYTTGTRIALVTTGNGSTTNTVKGQWNYVQGLTSAFVDGTATAPTIFTVPAGKTLLGLHPDGLTKFWSGDYTMNVEYHAGSEALNPALLTREQQLGRRLDLVGAYVSWGEWTGASGAAYPGNIQSNLANIVKAGRGLLLSFFDINSAPADWKAGTLSGAYDSVYTTLADYLVSLAPTAGQVLMRLSWEMNLANWGTDPAGFIAYWRYVVNLMRSRDPGGLLKFIWCPSGSGTPLWTDFWPGVSYVDAIGLDKYNGAPFADLKTIWTQTSSANPSNTNFYQTFLTYGLPYVHCETGSREQSDATLPSAQPTTKAQWINNIHGVSTDLPNIRGIMPWDKQTPTGPDYHVDTAPGPHHWPLSDPSTYSTSDSNPTWFAFRNLFRATEFGGSTLKTQDVTLTGVAPVYFPAGAGGNAFPPDADTVLHVKNADGSAHTITVSIPHPRGMSVSEAVTVPAGGERFVGSFPADWFADYTNEGLAQVTYDDPTGLSIAAIRAQLPV